MHTGDMMARKGLPFIDADNTNGSATEFASTLRNTVDAVENVDTIIPGHADEPLTWDDLVDYAAFYDDLLTRAQAGAAAGRSVAETAAVYSPPAEYSDFQAPADRVESIVRLNLRGALIGRDGLRPAGPPPRRRPGSAGGRPAAW